MESKKISILEYSNESLKKNKIVKYKSNITRDILKCYISNINFVQFEIIVNYNIGFKFS